MNSEKGFSAFQAPSPVLLSSACSVVLGNNASPNMTELSYPYRKAVLIDEIRFDMWAEAGVAGPQFNLGAIVYAKFQLGQHYLMRDPVPVWLLGTMMVLSEEELLDTYLDTQQLVLSHYRWRLPQPLYVEAGQVLRPTFNRVANPTNRPTGNITVQVSYAGRVVPPSTPRPGVLAVPYAASFVTTAGNVYQQSNEYHLFNPFDKPLKVQRLTGRVSQTTAAATLLIGQTAITPATAGSAVTVQIFDSWGYKMVNDLTGPGDVFDALRAAWTVDTVLPAKGQYDVRVRNIPNGSPAQQVHIGMIGMREEAL